MEPLAWMYLTKSMSRRSKSDTRLRNVLGKQTLKNLGRSLSKGGSGALFLSSSSMRLRLGIVVYNGW